MDYCKAVEVEELQCQAGQHRGESSCGCGYEQVGKDCYEQGEDCEGDVGQYSERVAGGYRG